MAHTKSAQKRIRQTEVRTERNRAAKSRIRTLRKKVADALTAGDKTAATAAAKIALNNKCKMLCLRVMRISFIEDCLPLYFFKPVTTFQKKVESKFCWKRTEGRAKL